jgi:hypothetical protein
MHSIKNELEHKISKIFPRYYGDAFLIDSYLFIDLTNLLITSLDNETYDIYHIITQIFIDINYERKKY